MEELILKILGNIHIVFLGIFILSFVVPIIISITRSKIKEKVLNKYSIFMDSVAFSRMTAIFVMLLFLSVGLIVMYLSSREYELDKNKSIGGIICSFIFIVPPIIFIIKTLKETIKILTGKYVIIIDQLMDKNYYNDHGYFGFEGVDHSGWLLYFRDYLKKYNEKIKIINMKRGDLAKKGDNFYLVFVKGNKYPYIYECKKYELEKYEKDKLKTIDEVKGYISKKEFVLEKLEQSERSIINKDKIKKDFTKAGHRKTSIILALVSIFLILFLLMSIFDFKNLTVTIIILLLTVIWIFLTIVKIKYILTIYSNINKGNFKIKEDEVISLNDRIQYSDSNSVISFKFKNYKKIVYEDKRVYHDTQVGDKFYLVFIKGEKEPIMVYNAKNSVIKN